MKVTFSRKSIRTLLAGAVHPVVLVPTMGALHAGHMALVTRARKLAGKDGTVVVSVFINPTQFGSGEDLKNYPRPRRQDLALCREAGVDVFYEPKAEAMYLPDHSVYVDESLLAIGLCGGSRVGHFRGVCTVVTKLFNIIQPDSAVFGKKDYQQLSILRRMVRDLDFPIKIIAVPTVRERDGLAMSSRNRLLTAQARLQAPVLFQALKQVRKACAGGEKRVAILRRLLLQHLETAAGGVVDYAEIVDAESLQPLRKIERSAVVAIAVRFGRTRLIDNIIIV